MFNTTVEILRKNYITQDFAEKSANQRIKANTSLPKLSNYFYTKKHEMYCLYVCIINTFKSIVLYFSIIFHLIMSFAVFHGIVVLYLIKSVACFLEVVIPLIAGWFRSYLTSPNQRLFGKSLWEKWKLSSGTNSAQMLDGHCCTLFASLWTIMIMWYFFA